MSSKIAPRLRGLADEVAAIEPPDPPPPRPPTPGPLGTIIPLYSFPTDAGWTRLIAEKAAKPKVRVVAVVNPQSGPGQMKNVAYVNGIGRLVAAGIVVAGYVHTSYGLRKEAEVQGEVKLWHDFYPNVSGIFFDEMSPEAGNIDYYKRQSAYAKSLGVQMTIGNPGSDCDPACVGSVDVICIYESNGLPTEARLAGWHDKHPPTNFAILPHDVPALPSTFVAMARKHVYWIYLTDDKLVPNPWNNLATYLPQLMGDLNT